MRLTITILSGARAGERVPLGPGEMLRVGRTSGANIVVADDPTMSGIHYLVRCTNEGGSVHDLESRNGLFLNGRQVDQAMLSDGDEIRAGRTYFTISVDAASLETRGAKGRFGSADETRAPKAGESTQAELPRAPNRPAKTSGPATLYLPDPTPAPRSLPTDDDETIDSSAMSTMWKDERRKQRLTPIPRPPDQRPPVVAPPPQPPPAPEPRSQAQQFEEQPPAERLPEQHRHEERPHEAPPVVEYDRLYAIIDGVGARGLVREAKRVNLRTESLLPSGSSPYLAAVVPHLVEVELDSDFLRLWRTMLAKAPGILLESRLAFDAMLTEVRTLFLGKDEQGKQNYFRFYDPNVLYEWLTMGDTARQAGFFAFATAAIIGLDKGERLLRLSFSGDSLNEEAVFTS